MSYSKYRAKPTVIDGIKFASKLEANQYLELKLQEKAGLIIKLELQKKLNFYMSGNPIFYYVADFIFYDVKKHIVVIADAKGFPTALFKLKWKLIQAAYPEFEYRLLGTRKKRRRK